MSLRRDPGISYKKELENLVNRGYKAVVHKKEKSFLVPVTCEPIMSYLPKVHKNPVCPPGMPHSQRDWLSDVLGGQIYIDTYLQPLVRTTRTLDISLTLLINTNFRRVGGSPRCTTLYHMSWASLWCHIT